MKKPSLRVVTILTPAISAILFLATPANATVCSDGWVSSSVGSGTCSHHGGELTPVFTYPNAGLPQHPSVGTTTYGNGGTGPDTGATGGISDLWLIIGGLAAMLGWQFRKAQRLAARLSSRDAKTDTTMLSD